MNLQRQIWALAVSLLLPAGQAAQAAGASPTDDGTAPHFAPRGEISKRQRANLQLDSVLVPGGVPYPGTQFMVLRTEPDAFGKTRYEVVASAGPHGHTEFDLWPGRYTVQARNGAVTVELPVEVPVNGSTRAQVVLDAGELHLGSVLDEQGQPADETWFRVWREDTDSYGRPLRVQVAGNGYGQTASFLLPAGDYIAEASYGDARVEVPVRITAGAVASQALVLNAGRLEVFGSLRAGDGPVNDATFSVHRRSPDDDGGWTEVSRAEHAETVTFVLPQGDYRARAELDRAVVELPVTVEAGQTHSLEMPLNAGELRVYATLAGQSDPLLDAWFDVRLDPPVKSMQPATLATPRGPAPSMGYVLPAGRYRAAAGLGESTGSVAVDIEAGARQTLAIDLDAARVTLSLIPDTGHAAYPYTWFSVYRIEQDGQGREWRRRVINTGYYPQTDIVLPAGRYVTFARSDEHRGEATFSVAPGEVKVLPIMANR